MKKLLTLMLCLILSLVGLALFSCDDECDEHDWGEWSVTTSPTCESEGEQQRTCKNCSAKDTQALEKTEHTYQMSSWRWGEDAGFAFLKLSCAINPAHETEISATLTEEAGAMAGCTSTGTKYIRASAVFNGTTYTDSKEIITPALGHDYKNDGSCSRCTSTCQHSETEKKYLNLADHGYCPSYIGYTECKVCKNQTLDTENLSYLCSLDENGTCTVCGIKSIQNFTENTYGCYSEFSLTLKIFDDQKTYLDGSVQTQGENHRNISYIDFDLREYSDCHNYFRVGVCEDCGENVYLNEYKIFCNDGVLPEATTATKLDGLTHNLTTVNCEDCSLTIVIDKYRKMDGCSYTDYTEIVLYDENDSPITSFISKDNGDVSCDWEMTYKFVDEQNKNCYDGALIIGDCKNCHRKISTTVQNHALTTNTPVDMSSYTDLCEGSWLVNRVCNACGLVADIGYELGCDMLPSMETVNGVNVMTMTCQNCPLKYSYSMSTDENCHTTMPREIFYGDTLIVSVTYEYTQHELEHSYNLLGETCAYGVEITSTCVNCDYSTKKTLNKCDDIIEETYDFSKYDSTLADTTALEISKCPCGALVDSNIDEIGFYKFQSSAIDGAVKYESQNGSVVILITGSSISDGCVHKKYNTVKITIDDVVVLENYTYLFDESRDHTYENIDVNLIDNNCEAGVYYARACADCDEYDIYFSTFHNSSLIYSLDFDDNRPDDICTSHSLEVRACPCGRQSSVEGDFSSFSCTYVDNVPVYSCDQCDYKVRLKTDDETEDNCFVLYYTSIEICNGNVPFYEKLISYREKRHTVTPTMAVDANGNPRITQTCSECGTVVASTMYNASSSMRADGSIAYELEINPTTTGIYSFYSTSNKDTGAKLYEIVDGKRELLVENDDDGYNTNFLIKYELKAGSSYVLVAGDYQFEEEIVFSIVMAEGDIETCSLCYTTEHTLPLNATGCENREVKIEACPSCLTIFDIEFISLHTLEYELVNNGEYYSFVGECSASGCNYSTVAEIRNANIPEGDNYFTYTFTIEESGYYLIYSIGDYDTYVDVYIDDSFLASDDDDGAYNNFLFNNYLDQGTTCTINISCYNSEAVVTPFVIQKYDCCDYLECASTKTLNDSVVYCPECGSIHGFTASNDEE